jgi:hypothetical protein
MFLRHCSTFGNLGQKQGKFIPTVKTSNIKKQFVSIKDGKNLMGSNIEGFIVFFSILKQRNHCLPKLHIWILQIFNFLGGPINKGGKKNSNSSIICFPKKM